MPLMPITDKYERQPAVLQAPYMPNTERPEKQTIPITQMPLMPITDKYERQPAVLQAPYMPNTERPENTVNRKATEMPLMPITDIPKNETEKQDDMQSVFKPFAEHTTGTGYKSEMKIIEWKGLNQRDTIDTGELSYTKNISSDALPYLIPRPSRSDYKTGITNPQGMFATEDALLWVGVKTGNDVLFYDDGITVTEYTLGTHTTDIIRTMVDFNGKVLIFPDKKYLDYEASPKVFGSIATCPDIDYATVYNNRVFGVKGNEVYATALGKYNDWTTLSTPLQPTDSWAADVASKGDFKGIATYNNHVVMFKSEFMHEQYGTKPPFRIQDLYTVGTIDNRTIQEVQNRLYFADDKNVYVYAGGEPRPISINLDKKIVQAVAGSDNRKYYISAYDGSTWNLYVYDTYFDVWMREDNLQIVDFAYWGKYLYALTSAGKIIKFNSGSESVSWEAITDISTLGNIGTKYINEIRMRFELGTTSQMTVYIKYDNDEWKSVKAYDNSADGDTSLKTLRIPINPEMADRYQIKLAGTGYAKIYQIMQEIRGGD
jgi:hypothetical protein